MIAWADAAEDVAILAVFLGVFGAAFIGGQLAYRCRVGR